MNQKTTRISPEEIARQKDFCAQIHAMNAALPAQPLAYVDTYGCQQNEADSERLRGYLSEMGYQFTQSEAEADLIVINTCAIREHAEMRVLGNVGALVHTKRAKPGQLICVCGCMAQEAHIQIDTGMGFGGFLADEPEKILSVYRNLPNVAVSGICTQLHARKKGGEDLAARLGQFHRVVEAIRAAGFETGVVHAAGSYALLHCADARLDGVRAGSALLGRCRRVHGDGLYRVGYGEVGIEETRWLPKGHTVGSARPVVLRRPTRVAVLPVGYQNGFGVARAQGGGLGALLRRWLAARRRTVRVNGQRARILGAIGAIETVVDVTDLKCSAGDPAVFDIDPLYARGFVREYR